MSEGTYPSSLDDARRQLRARQGLGARYDSPNAPARELSWARLGAAYFARKLNELSDADLDAPSLVAGWSRRHVISRVGYQARALARLVEAARTGIPTRPYEELEQRSWEIEDGATLPARALRYLYDHAQIHLDVEWRDLDAQGWDRITTSDGIPPIVARETPWMRAQLIWLSAVDLDNGGSFADLPRDLHARLVEIYGQGGSAASLSGNAPAIARLHQVSQVP